jgi:hypothetical protein
MTEQGTVDPVAVGTAFDAAMRAGGLLSLKQPEIRYRAKDSRDTTWRPRADWIAYVAAQPGWTHAYAEHAFDLWSQAGALEEQVAAGKLYRAPTTMHPPASREGWICWWLSQQSVPDRDRAERWVDDCMYDGRLIEVVDGTDVGPTHATPGIDPRPFKFPLETVAAHRESHAMADPGVPHDATMSPALMIAIAAGLDRTRAIEILAELDRLGWELKEKKCDR